MTKTNKNHEVFKVLPWSDNFKVGNATIDKQHQVLVALLNKLADTLIDSDETKIIKIFDELASYAKIHFKDEEEIWLKYFPNDPWLLSHQTTHNSFLPSVMKIKEQTDKTLPDIIEEIVHFLLRWLLLHIIDSDKRMVFAIKAIEAGSTVNEAKLIADKKMNNSSQILIDAMLTMYEELSSRTITILRERKARKDAEHKLNEANEQLELLVITDPLTHLYNRRHFDDTLELQLKMAVRNKTALCFFLIDIDFFKRINDSYGHQAGDLALKRLGDCLLNLCYRPDDMVFRLGGEEFGILTSNHALEKANQFAEIIRKAIQDLKIPNLNSDTSDYMTASIGGIHIYPSLKNSPDELYNIADKRLYRAKASGRNQIVLSD